jgi:hypothetical protein
LIPDPAFYAEYRSGSGSKVLMTKNWKKFIAGKKFGIFFKSKVAVYLSLALRKGRPSYRSLESLKEKIQHFKS